MDALLQKFYDYLKDKYGIKQTEILNPEETILCSIKIVIPGFRKNNPKHSWQAHLEEGHEEQRLIIGERWADAGSSWSRFIEIKKQGDNPNLFISIIENMFFRKGFDFETWNVFTEVVKDFFREDMGENMTEEK